MYNNNNIVFNIEEMDLTKSETRNCIICFEENKCFVNGFFKRVYNNKPISKENCERSCVCKVDICDNCVKKLCNKCPTCRTKFEAWGDLLTTQNDTNFHRPALNNDRPAFGFNGPKNISNQLADFLGKPRGTQMSPLEAVRGIMTYINIKKLIDKNKKNINPDANLAALLNLNETDELTIFNFQRYLSNHYIN
jgi:hypothetical protein